MTALNVHERTELAKETLCNYLKTHKDVTMPDLMKALNLTKNQATHYLKFLTERGHVAKYVQRNKAKRFAVYNLGRTPFSKKAKPVIESIVDKTVHVPHARVVKLTDRPYFSDLMPKKYKTTVSIGSGMTMFNMEA